MQSTIRAPETWVLLECGTFGDENAKYKVEVRLGKSEINWWPPQLRAKISYTDGRKYKIPSTSSTIEWQNIEAWLPRDEWRKFAQAKDPKCFDVQIVRQAPESFKIRIVCCRALSDPFQLFKGTQLKQANSYVSTLNPETLTTLSFKEFEQLVARNIDMEFESQFASLNLSSLQAESCKERYLDFAISVSRNMQHCGVRSVSRGELEILQKNAASFIREREEEKKLAASSARAQTNPEEVARDIQARDRHIDKLKIAPQSLYEQLFAADPITSTLRRGALLIEGPDGKVGFCCPSGYEWFRRIDDFSEQKKIKELFSKTGP